VLHEQFRLLDDVVRREGGAVVKTIGEGLLAAFPDADAAVRAGIQFPEVLRAGELTRGLRLRVAAHRGPAMAATLNDHLDYFGTTVHQTMQALARSRGGLFVLTRAVASDPDVSARLIRCGRIGTVLDEGPSSVSFGPLIELSIDPAETPGHDIGLKPPARRSMARS
jgi:class 3 adenylate cyclase